MSIYLCLLIPILTVLVLYFFFRHKTVWWEFIIPVVGSVIFIFVAKYMAIESLIRDVQYLGGYVKEVKYYEPWDETVPCRHPIYCTSCSGSGKSRSCRTYVCGYYHPYDVDYHPANWVAETTLGQYGITKSYYDQIVDKRFIVTPQFKDMHRRFHTINGNMYYASWDGKDETLESVVKSEEYENRPKASQSIYRFQEVDSIDYKEYHPFEYPQIIDPFHQQALMGFNDLTAERKLQILNSRLGGSKHVKVFVIVFKNKPREAGHIQERYWEGSNKNEYIITIGVDEANKVKWAYDFSWTEVAETKVDTEKFIENQEFLDLSSVIDFLDGEIQSKWVPRNFHEFDILTIQPSISAVIIILLLTIAINVGMSIWIIKNDFDEDNK